MIGIFIAIVLVMTFIHGWGEYEAKQFAIMKISENWQKQYDLAKKAEKSGKNVDAEALAKLKVEIKRLSELRKEYSLWKGFLNGFVAGVVLGAIFVAGVLFFSTFLSGEMHFMNPELDTSSMAPIYAAVVTALLHYFIDYIKTGSRSFIQGVVEN